MNFTALENDYFHNCSFDYRLVIIIMVIIVHPRVFTPPLPLPFLTRVNRWPIILTC